MVIRRLPRYYRFLTELEQQGVERINSGRLAELMGSTASQVRQDLNCFGGFGHQGYGYSVAHLRNEISGILGINKLHKAVLIGAGYVGTAVVLRLRFLNMGFELAGVFEKRQEAVGTYVGKYRVRDVAKLESFIDRNPDVKTAFLCVPQSVAPEVVKKLWDNGIRSFWNFSHYNINADYPDAVVENVHLSDSLMTLCYKINEVENKDE